MQLANSARNLKMGPLRSHFAQEAAKRKLWIHPGSKIEDVKGDTVGGVSDKLDIKAGSRLGRVSKALGGAALKIAGATGLVAAVIALPIPLVATGLAATGSVALVAGDELLKESGQQSMYADASKVLKEEANRRAAQLQQTAGQDPELGIIVK